MEGDHGLGGQGDDGGGRGMTVGAMITVLLWLAASARGHAAPTDDFDWPAAADSAIVRSLTISRGNIFTPDEPEASRFYARLANALHIVTREHVVRRGLYFTEGDTISAADLAASVRRLRTYPFLRTRIDLDVAGDHDSVDVTVRTSDAWSTRPEARLSQSGDLFEWSFSLRESNLLGLGKEIGVEVGREDQRLFWSGKYADQQLLGSDWQLGLSVAAGEDLEAQGVTLWRPFGRPATPWGFHVEAGRYEGTLIDRRGGLDGPEWETRRWSLVANGGVRISGDERGAVRLKAFAYLVSERYTPPDDSSEWVASDDGASGPNAHAPLRERQIRGVGLALSRIDERFFRFTRIDALGQYEDIDLGGRFEAGAAYSPASWGALRDGIVLTLDGCQGIGLGRESFLRLSARGVGLLAAGRLEDALIEGSARFHGRIDTRQTLALGIRGEFGVRVAPQRFPTLGAHNGLRGFDAYRFCGERMILANVEERVLVVEDLFGLVSVGMAAFADVGTTWIAGRREAARPRVAAGVGLRLEASRTSGVLVTRLDLGYPVVGGDREDGWVLSFGSGQAF